MLVIALTGGIGSGKTTVSNIFKSKNIPVIDTDIIARQLVETDTQAYSQIIDAFGESILTEEDKINRQALRQLIFNSEQKRKSLEKNLHPLIWNEVRVQLAKNAAPYTIVVIPLLFENINNINKIKIARILVVDTDENLQIQRATNRDNGDESTVKKIIKSQVSRETRLDGADDVISNQDDIESLEQKVELMHKKYLELSGCK